MGKNLNKKIIYITTTNISVKNIHQSKLSKTVVTDRLQTVMDFHFSLKRQTYSYVYTCEISLSCEDCDITIEQFMRSH